MHAARCCFSASAIRPVPSVCLCSEVKLSIPFCEQRVCEGSIVYARPPFSGVCGLLLSVYLCGTFRTVFGSPGTGHKVCTADLAATGPFGTEDRVLQFRLQRENSAPEVLADQTVGYGLRTDIGIAIVQQKAVSIVVVAALASEFSDASGLSGCEPRQRICRVFRICNFTFHRFPPS